MAPTPDRLLPSLGGSRFSTSKPREGWMLMRPFHFLLCTPVSFDLPLPVSLHITSFPHRHPTLSGPNLHSTPLLECSHTEIFTAVGPSGYSEYFKCSDIYQRWRCSGEPKSRLDCWLPWHANVLMQASPGQSEVLTVRKACFCLNKNIFFKLPKDFSWFRGVAGWESFNPGYRNGENN